MKIDQSKLKVKKIEKRFHTVFRNVLEKFQPCMNVYVAKMEAIRHKTSRVVRQQKI